MKHTPFYVTRSDINFSIASKKNINDNDDAGNDDDVVDCKKSVKQYKYNQRYDTRRLWWMMIMIWPHVLLKRFKNRNLRPKWAI